MTVSLSFPALQERLANPSGYTLILAIAVAYWVGLFYYRSETYKLRHVPTVGYTSPLLYYLNVLKFTMNSTAVIAEGVNKWPGKMFKYASLGRWVVLSTDPKTTEEIYKAPDRVMLGKPALDEMLQTEYIFGQNFVENTYEVSVVKSHLTRKLPQLVPEVHDELLAAFHDYLPQTDDWSAVPAYDTFIKVVARASNRVFVGLPLCRNPEYIKLAVDYTMDIMAQATLLFALPSWLRVVVNSFGSLPRRRVRQALKYFRPLIALRRQDLEAVAKGQPGTYNDFLTWLMEEADEKEQSELNLTARVLLINFAAIHTSSMTFLHTLYYVAANPDYVKLLRQEAEDVTQREGWSKEALDDMHIADSVIKESQRLRTIGNVVLRRMLLQDHTFSDGTALPAGTVVMAAVAPAHFDSNTYEDPYTFDPLRFVKLKQQEAGKENQFNMISTGANSLPFGHGRHACPGRYFAASELKMMLAHLVLHYDVKLENEGVRPDDIWFGETRMPNTKAKVLFRKRTKQ